MSMWQNIFSGQLGWKTMVGIGLMVVAFGIDLSGITKLATVERLFGLGQIIAFFGLRDAIRKR